MAPSHHYVPRFYLRRFADSSGSIWVFDKQTDRTFRTTPENVAAENGFYTLDYLSPFGPTAPYEMEKQFSELEFNASRILQIWTEQIDHGSDRVETPSSYRAEVSLFVTVQLFRTREARAQLVEFVERVMTKMQADELLADVNRLHADFVWNGELMKRYADHLNQFVWIFAKNNGPTRFMSSDHPVLVKSGDNKHWITGPRIFDPEIYLAWPLDPNHVLYLYEPNYRGKLNEFDMSVSPVPFDSDMANHENSGQIAMSFRFVFSISDHFQFAREFLGDQPYFSDPNRLRLAP